MCMSEVKMVCILYHHHAISFECELTKTVLKLMNRWQNLCLTSCLSENFASL